jgi:hypothetical protein
MANAFRLASYNRTAIGGRTFNSDYDERLEDGLLNMVRRWRGGRLSKTESVPDRPTTPPPPENRRRERRRFTIADYLMIVAVIAANVALVSQVFNVSGPGSWIVAAMVLGVNALFCLVFGVVLRFRMIPLLAMFTTAALTEAILWQAAISKRNNTWIVVIALLGGALLAVVVMRVRAVRRR